MPLNLCSSKNSWKDIMTRLYSFGVFCNKLSSGDEGSQQLEDTKKILDRTYKRLQEEMPAVKTVKDAISTIGGRTALSEALYFSQYYENDISGEFALESLNEEDWYRGIELFLAYEHPEVFESKDCKNFAYACRGKIPKVCTFVVMAHFIEKENRLHSLLNETAEGMSDAIRRIEAIEEKAEPFRESEEYQEYLRLKVENSALTKKAEELEKQLEVKQNEIKRITKKANDLARTVKKLEDELNTIDEDPACESSFSKTEREELEKLTPQIDKSDADELEALKTVQLPDNVLFCGGHIRMLNKIKLLYPNWSYLTTRKGIIKGFGITSPAFVVVFWKHTEHKYIEKIKSQYKDASVIFVDSVNIENLELQIKKGFLALQRRGQLGGK